jgi:hypothetical protein
MAMNTTADLVDSAHITQLELTITSPALENFDLIDTIRAYLFDGVNEVQVAIDQPHVDDGAKTITFQANHVDVKEFVKLDMFKCRFWISLDENPLNNISITVDVTFKVYAKEQKD